jgi:hypothetical protein
MLKVQTVAQEMGIPLRFVLAECRHGHLVSFGKGKDRYVSPEAKIKWQATRSWAIKSERDLEIARRVANSQLKLF